MLDVEEALLISEPKTRFSVPIKVTHYPGYLEEREKLDTNCLSQERSPEWMSGLERFGERAKRWNCDVKLAFLGFLTSLFLCGRCRESSVHPAPGTPPRRASSSIVLCAPL